MFARKLVTGLIFACMAGGELSDAHADPQAEPYQFGVLPFLPPTRVEVLYGPFAQAFEKALGRPVVFRTRSTYAQFTAALQAGAFDFALVQPLDYVKAADRQGYIPLARYNEPLYGIVVVRDDSPLHDIKDLHGQTLGVPPQESSVVPTLVLWMLRDKGLANSVTLHSYETPEACMLAAMSRKADACVTTAVPLKLFANAHQAQFRVLGQTPAIPNGPFIVHPRVPQAEREQLRATILFWGQDGLSRHMLDQAGLNGIYVPTTAADYDGVRKLARGAGP